MPTNPFHFKQFSITQNNAAMKVGTDGVLLGSWVKLNNPQKVLDIGTGTGLISLMLAQRANTAIIDAIDIDTNAILDASQNVERSRWWDKIRVHNSSIEEFDISKTGYDLIVSNPPYFESIEKNPSSRELARQNSKLSLETLVTNSSRLLTNDGEVAYVLPIALESKILILLAANGLRPSHICKIKSTSGKPQSRILIQAGKKKTETQFSQLVLEPNERHKYSKGYIKLTEDFYL